MFSRRTKRDELFNTNLDSVARDSASSLEGLGALRSVSAADEKDSYQRVTATEVPRRHNLALAGNKPTRRIGPGEVLLATMVALTIYTTLLLRLPYRSPVTNSLYSVLALATFYFYLRLRLRIRLPALMLLCLVLSILLDVVGNHFGLFSRRIALIPYDTITHFTSSGLSFIPVMWLLMALLRRFDYRLPLGFVTFFSATTAFSLAAYYEITELIDERFFGGQRIWTPRDTVQDLAADLAGIVIAAFFCALVLKRRRART
ncbi:MAG TPA: hypothetical protein VLM38_18020 [Blastocatellia bacterium]|nr:hypothetical protein [Blastocatellia bacterium]